MDLPDFIRSLAPDVTGAINRAAKLFNTQPGTVKGWLYGERRPRPEMARRIVRKTRGKVQLEGVYPQ